MILDFNRLVVTGANGWVGRAALSRAVQWWGPDAARNVAAFGSTGATLEIEGTRFDVAPISDLTPAHLEDAFVLHLAFLTKDRISQSSASLFMNTNEQIDSFVISAAEHSSPRGIFVASSGAAKLFEDGGGDIYGQAKFLQEQRYAKFCSSFNGSLLRGRIWSIAGPFMNKPHAYALADMLFQGRRTQRIHINAKSPVYRSYVHVEDLIGLIISTLVSKCAPTEVIDLAGMEILEMQDVALVVAESLGLPPASISRPALDLSTRNRYVGDWAPLRELALTNGIVTRSFREQVDDTLAYFDRTANQY